MEPPAGCPGLPGGRRRPAPRPGSRAARRGLAAGSFPPPLAGGRRAGRGAGAVHAATGFPLARPRSGSRGTAEGAAGDRHADPAAPGLGPQRVHARGGRPVPARRRADGPGRESPGLRRYARPPRQCPAPGLSADLPARPVRAGGGFHRRRARGQRTRCRGVRVRPPAGRSQRDRPGRGRARPAGLGGRRAGAHRWPPDDRHRRFAAGPRLAPARPAPAAETGPRPEAQGGAGPACRTPGHHDPLRHGHGEPLAAQRRRRPVRHPPGRRGLPPGSRRRPLALRPAPGAGRQAGGLAGGNRPPD